MHESKQNQDVCNNFSNNLLIMDLNALENQKGLTLALN